MADSTPSSGRPRPSWPATREAAQALLGALMAAWREGALDELVARRPVLARRLRERHLPWVRSGLGALGSGGDDLARQVRSFLRWLAYRPAPGQSADAALPTRARWLHQTSWRPLLGVLAQAGLEEVPNWPEVYRRHANETPVENLCGLWGVGASTGYRYLEKGRAALAAALLELRDDVPTRLSQWRFAAADARAAGLAAAEASARCAQAGDAVGALLHLGDGGQWRAMGALLRQRVAEVGDSAELALFLAQALEAQVEPAVRAELLLARAAIHQCRGDEAGERGELDAALRAAAPAQRPELLGRVHVRLGEHFETRDTDRSLAYYEDACHLLHEAHADPAQRDPTLASAYCFALARRAWFAALGNDARARLLLEAAGAVQAQDPGIDAATLATLEQVRSEVARRAGDFRRALSHQHRALNVYERLGDRLRILTSFSNLSILYAEVRDFARAVGYARRATALAPGVAVEPRVRVGAHINLGSALFWLEDYGAAIAEYEAALDLALACGLSVYANRARYNLAEACFKRGAVLGSEEDLARGDALVRQIAEAPRTEVDTFLQDAAAQLKAEAVAEPAHGYALTRLSTAEILGDAQTERLLHEQRDLLATPGPAETHIRARLALARAFADLAAREAALAAEAIQRSGSEAQFAQALETLKAVRLTGGGGLDPALRARWDRLAAALLPPDKLAALLDELQQHRWLKKASAAQRLEVSPATASRYLAELARLGLLRQVGQGAATRYEMADAG